jgi:hypothetical protein
VQAGERSSLEPPEERFPVERLCESVGVPNQRPGRWSLRRNRRFRSFHGPAGSGSSSRLRRRSRFGSVLRACASIASLLSIPIQRAFGCRARTARAVSPVPTPSSSTSRTTRRPQSQPQLPSADRSRTESRRPSARDRSRDPIRRSPWFQSATRPPAQPERIRLRRSSQPDQPLVRIRAADSFDRVPEHIRGLKGPDGVRNRAAALRHLPPMGERR